MHCFFYGLAVGGTAEQPPSDRLLRARESCDLVMLIFIKESPGELALGAVWRRCVIDGLAKGAA
jgi:hypothetical protein